MSASPLKLAGLDLSAPNDLRKLGDVLLLVTLTGALLLLSLVLWKKPEYVLAVPAVVVVGALAVFLFKHPLLNLCVLLAGVVVVSDYEAGIQAREVLYGLYYLGFLAHFFFTRIVLRGERLFQQTEEKALALFVVGITASIGLTILWDGDLKEVLSQWTALVLLLLYFPIKEAFVRYPKAPILILAIVAWVGLFAALRNLYTYQTILSDASHVWQISRGRVVTNDNILMVSSLVLVTLLVFSDRWRYRVLVAPIFLGTFGGLILTQSRGFWVAFAFGAFILFLLVERRRKLNLLALALSGMALFVVAGFIFFPEYIDLILTGLLVRFGSLQTATTEDVSLVNRFLESRAVMADIARNPVIGYGMGVPFRFFDITYEAMRNDSFIHNGFLSVWYRFGLWGLLLIVVAWGGAIYRGIRAFRTSTATPMVRIAGAAAAISLIAYLLPANTSNPFHLNDSLFIFGVLFGIAGGAAARAKASAQLD